MKLKLSKRSIKKLSNDDKVLATKVTPQIGGAAPPPSQYCITDERCKTGTFKTFYCL